jgi:hypothetical protein
MVKDSTISDRNGGRGLRPTRGAGRRWSVLFACVGGANPFKTYEFWKIFVTLILR